MKIRFVLICLIPFCIWNTKAFSQKNYPFHYNKLLVQKSDLSGDNLDEPFNSDSSSPKYEERLFSGNKIHQYLGLASLLSAAATIPTRPDDDDEVNGTHAQLAYAAAGLGVAAIVTGFVYHWDDVFNYSVMDPDNLHMTLGILGTLGYLGAISDAPEENHAALGILGIASMSLAIWITW